MKQEKYGFVYIWFDRKHKRFYIGSHWGDEQDGYVCSSTWMKQAYKIRPQDFKRKILSRIYTNKSDLLVKEYEWLSLISDDEIKNQKYYNRTKHKNGHWTAEDYEGDVKKRISISTKEAMAKPDVREKYLLGLETRTYNRSEEVKEKRSTAIKATLAIKFPLENRPVRKDPNPNLSAAVKRQWDIPGFREAFSAKKKAKFYLKIESYSEAIESTKHLSIWDASKVLNLNAGAIKTYREYLYGLQGSGF